MLKMISCLTKDHISANVFAFQYLQYKIILIIINRPFSTEKTSIFSVMLGGTILLSSIMYEIFILYFVLYLYPKKHDALNQKLALVTPFGLSIM